MKDSMIHPPINNYWTNCGFNLKKESLKYPHHEYRDRQPVWNSQDKQSDTNDKKSKWTKYQSTCNAAPPLKFEDQNQSLFLYLKTLTRNKCIHALQYQFDIKYE